MPFPLVTRGQDDPQLARALHGDRDHGQVRGDVRTGVLQDQGHHLGPGEPDSRLFVTSEAGGQPAFTAA